METIRNLTPFTSYNCTLHAVTVSDGPLSDPIKVTTAEHGMYIDDQSIMLIILLYVAPTAPIIKNITVIDSGSIYVEWNIPMETNGALTIYTISFSDENGSVMSIIVPFSGQNVRYCYIT